MILSFSFNYSFFIIKYNKIFIITSFSKRIINSSFFLAFSKVSFENTDRL